MVTGDVPEDRVGWFRRSGGVWTLLPPGEGEGGWKAFSTREVSIGVGWVGGRGAIEREIVALFFHEKVSSVQ